MNRAIKKFAYALTQLEPIEFIGVARFLNIKLFAKEETNGLEAKARPFEDIFTELVTIFENLNRKQKRTLFSIVRAAAGTIENKKEDVNAR